MRKTAQTCLQAADIDGRLRKCAACQHGIDGYGTVWTFAADAARCIGIIVTAFFGSRIMCDHGVDVSCIDEDAIARPTHCGKIPLVRKARLR